MRGASRFSLAVAYGLISFIWGSTYLAIKVGLESFDPFFFAGLRYLLATALAYAWARWRGVRFAGSLSHWLPAFAVGVLFIGVCNGAIFWAETRLDSAYTALLITVNPVWAALLTPLYRGEERLNARGWLGVLLGFVGTAVLLAPWRAVTPELGAAVVVLVSSLIWAATALGVRRVRERYDSLALTVAQMAAGATVLLAVAAARGQALVGPVTPRAAAALAYLVVFGSLVAFSAYFFLLRHIDATRVATSTYINPVVAMVLGVVLLDEVITWYMGLGILVVLAGVWLVMRRGGD